MNEVVGGLEHLLFFHILGISSSQLTFIFFRGVGLPATRLITNNYTTYFSTSTGVFAAQFHTSPGPVPLDLCLEKFLEADDSAQGTGSEINLGDVLLYI